MTCAVPSLVSCITQATGTAARNGDKLSFVIADDGRIEVKVPTYPDVASLAGATGMLEQPLNWDQMREMAREDRSRQRAADITGASGSRLISRPCHCTGMVAAACGVRITRLKKVAGCVVITVWTCPPGSQKNWPAW